MTTVCRHWQLYSNSMVDVLENMQGAKTRVTLDSRLPAWRRPVATALFISPIPAQCCGHNKCSMNLCSIGKERLRTNVSETCTRGWFPSLCTVSRSFVCLSLAWSMTQWAYHCVQGDWGHKGCHLCHLRSQNQEHRLNSTQATSPELCVNSKGDERQFPLPTYFFHNFFIIFSKWVQTARMPDTSSFTSLRTSQDSSLPLGTKSGPTSLLPQPQGLPRAVGNAALSCLRWEPPFPVDLAQSFSVNLPKKRGGVRSMTICSRASIIHICSKYNKRESLMSQTRYTQNSQWVLGIPEEENRFPKYSQAHLK